MLSFFLKLFEREHKCRIKKNSIEQYWWEELRFQRDVFFHVEKFRGEAILVEWVTVPEGRNKSDTSLVFFMSNVTIPKIIQVSYTSAIKTNQFRICT